MQSLPFEGRVFGRLTVLRRSEKKGYWWCQCSCGSLEKEIQHSNLTCGNTKSCGCASKEASIRRNTTHGKTNTLTYKTWQGMHTRCTNPNYKLFHRYGGRGIYVCERWQSFENFYQDMGDKPSGCSLDRMDNDGPYAPKNCRWATPKQQGRNRATAKMLTYKGKTQSLVEWAEEIGTSYGTLSKRSSRGWSAERIIEGPIVANGASSS
jgi:hypothetical protein